MVAVVAVMMAVVVVAVVVLMAVAVRRVVDGGDRGAAKPFIIEVAMSFCVAGVARLDIRTCFITCRKSFCVTAAILLHRFQKMTCILRGRGSTLKTSIVFLQGRRSTLDMSRWVFFANRSVRTASLGDKSQIPSRRGTW